MAGETQIALVREQTGNRVTDSIQTERDRLADILNKAPFLRGTHILRQSIPSGSTTRIVHKLGRAYVGYFITRYTNSGGGVPATPLLDVTVAADRDRFLDVQIASTNVVDIWIF